MIHSYGITQQGTLHIEKNTVCQDAHCFERVNEHCAIAAVADGLGSELYSDIASQIAAESSVKYCADNILLGLEDTDILQVIKDSFKHALSKIQAASEESGNSINEYDTTLALAVYNEGKVFYGNSGDSGIVILSQDGSYSVLTEQQRDENGNVYPLCFGEEWWVFGTVQNVSSVLLATDGILETLFPYLLRNEEVNIYVALARYLMDEESLGFEQTSDDFVRQQMSEFIASIPGSQVNDDKTLLVMLDTSYSAKKREEEYYLTPDWNALKKKHDEAFRRAAYPHLYKNEDAQTYTQPNEETYEANTPDTENIPCDSEDTANCHANQLQEETLSLGITTDSAASNTHFSKLSNAVKAIFKSRK